MSPTDKIPYENLNLLNKEFEDKFKSQFDEFLNKGWYIMGEGLSRFESSFAAYNKAKFCIGVANGLDALEIGLQVFDFPKDSEIIVPSNTYIATILAIINVGLKPILVEPDSTTYNINPDLIEQAITPKTKAIMVVHLYGQVAPMQKILELAQKYNLEIIEDCAQAHGATINHQKVGTFGNIGCFSFYPTKNLGALGDGGAIITSDENLYLKIKALRNYGSEKKYYNKYVGRNSRLDELQALFLNEKLPYLNKINQHKINLARIYHNGLTNQVIKPVFTEDYSHVYHIYNIRTEKRNELKKHLENQSIYTEIHYPVAPHLQEGYQSLWNGSFPISEEIHATTLSLPISYATSSAQVEKVVQAINQFFSL